MPGAAALYMMILIALIGHLVPLFVALRALRRAIRSRGFNRCLYAYVSLFSSGALLLLLQTGREDPLTYGLVLATAWLTLPLWLCTCEALRQVRRPRAAHGASAAWAARLLDLDPFSAAAKRTGLRRAA